MQNRHEICKSKLERTIILIIKEKEDSKSNIYTEILYYTPPSKVIQVDEGFEVASWADSSKPENDLHTHTTTKKNQLRSIIRY